MPESVALLSEIYPPEKYPSFSFGEGSYGGLGVAFWGWKVRLTVGKFCSFGPQCTAFLGGKHRVDWTTTYPFSALWEAGAGIEGHNTQENADVTIGNDVWVGAEAMILPGVTIGDGAVVAARTVVDRDVPAYAYVLGYPMKILKYRFDAQTVARLLKLKWWDQPKEWIERALPSLLSTDVEGFLDRAERGEFDGGF